MQAGKTTQKARKKLHCICLGVSQDRSLVSLFTVFILTSPQQPLPQATSRPCLKHVSPHGATLYKIMVQNLPAQHRSNAADKAPVVPCECCTSHTRKAEVATCSGAAYTGGLKQPEPSANKHTVAAFTHNHSLQLCSPCYHLCCSSPTTTPKLHLHHGDSEYTGNETDCYMPGSRFESESLLMALGVLSRVAFLLVV